MRLALPITLLALAVGWAQVSAADEVIRTEKTTTHTEKSASGIARAKDLMGVRVYNSNNESLGKIEDLVVDPSAGTIRYAVLSFGGILGLGDKLFAVPWKELKLVTKGTTSSGTMKEDYYVLDVSKEALKNAPGFDKSSWPNFADNDFTAKIDRFYGTQKAERGSTTR